MIIDFFPNVPNAFGRMHIVNLSYVEDFPINVLIQEPTMSSCQYFTDVFKGNVHNTKMLTTINCPNILNIPLGIGAY